MSIKNIYKIRIDVDGDVSLKIRSMHREYFIFNTGYIRLMGKAFYKNPTNLIVEITREPDSLMFSKKLISQFKEYLK